jgi:hypothetical protein
MTRLESVTDRQHADAGLVIPATTHFIDRHPTCAISMTPLSMLPAFTLNVSLLASSNASILAKLKEAMVPGCNVDSDVCSAVYADSCRITQGHHNNVKIQQDSPRFALVFVPAFIADSALERQKVELNEKGFVRFEADQARLLSTRLLSLVHPFLARNFPVKAVIPIRGPRPAAADLVLLDLSHTPTVAISDLLDQASCQTVQAAWEDAVLKLLLIADVQFQLPTASPLTQIREHEPCCDIPTCPVCLHRIAPWRLGLNAPLRNGQMCSKYCPPPNLLPSRIREPTISCPRQRLVLSWPPPAHCSACAVIDSYWRKQEDERSVAKEDDLFCFSCAMQQTLWVCLTCAFVGCGRYSNKHAADHYRQSGHPFCLELSTLRIWDYVVGEYAHRVDLLECPSSSP